MDIITFLVSVYCLVDDRIGHLILRRRGPQPTLTDAEVLTMEIVGEFLGLDAESELFRFFRRHYLAWFPNLAQVHRTTFTRQMANLWAVKRWLWQELIQELPQDPLISVVDSFPVPVCRFARAPRCQLFKGQANFGRDEVAKQTFYGFRAHVRLQWPGIIADLQVTPANVHDTEAVEHLLDGQQGWVLGDRNYWKPDLMDALRTHGLHLLAPYKSAKREPFRWPRKLVHMRYRIETVIGQLVERFHAKKVWARDRWHLTSRWMRKVLSHTVAVYFCFQAQLPPLSLAKLVI
jgi:hypothetical protein